MGAGWEGGGLWVLVVESERLGLMVTFVLLVSRAFIWLLWGWILEWAPGKSTPCSIMGIEDRNSLHNNTLSSDLTPRTFLTV